MKELFEEVSVEKVSDKIVDQLERLIKDGKLVPGNKLPGERQLIDMLGVGRSSLREALNKLETMGYVEIKKRKGIYVKSMASAMPLDPMKRMMLEDSRKIVQLYEVRSDIEQASAYSAALERNRKDLHDIEKCMAAFTVGGEAGYFSWDLDLAFHCSIARASHNVFRIHAVLSILEFSREFIQPILEDLANVGDNSAIIHRQHGAILDAIRSQDAGQARENMKLHLDWTNRRLIERLV